MKSPPRGCSILMTSAPCSPSKPAQKGAAMRVPRSRTRTPASGCVTRARSRACGPTGPALPTGAGAASSLLLPLDRVHTTRLARLGLLERGRGVRHELVEHEVVAPRLALAHEIDHVVDRRLHG